MAQASPRASPLVPSASPPLPPPSSLPPPLRLAALGVWLRHHVGPRPPSQFSSARSACPRCRRRSHHRSRAWTSTLQRCCRGRRELRARRPDCLGPDSTARCYRWDTRRGWRAGGTSCGTLCTATPAGRRVCARGGPHRPMQARCRARPTAARYIAPSGTPASASPSVPGCRLMGLRRGCFWRLT